MDWRRNQVVRADYSTAPAALIESAETRGSANVAINDDAACKAMGNTIMRGAWTACSWDPDRHLYLVTVQY